MKSMKSTDCSADHAAKIKKQKGNELSGGDCLAQLESEFLRGVLRDNWDDTSIQNLMAALGTAMDACRVYRYQVTPELDRGLVVQGWTAPEVEGRFEENHHQLSEIAMLMEMLDRDGFLMSEQLESGSSPIHEQMERRGTRSFMLAAIRQNGKLSGALGVTDTKQNRMWSPVEQATLRRLAGFISLVLERRDLRKRLDDAIRRIDDSESIKNNFLATMSHEVRNPLNAIIGLSGILLKSPASTLTSEERKMVDYIQEAGEKLLSMMEDVLYLSRVQLSSWHARKRMFSPLEFLMELRVFMQGRLHGLDRITFAARHDHVPSLLYSDPEALRRIAMNLLDNAVKFTPSGEIELTAGEEDGHFFLTVNDSGVGIPAEALDQIFEAFVQGEQVSTRRFSGVGIGLAIVRRLARAIGATLEVDSQEGRGTRITVRVPMEEGDHEPYPGRG